MSWQRSNWSALVVGTGRSATGLMPLAAVENNLTRLHEVLTDPSLVGMPVGNVTTVLDPAAPGEILAPLGQLAESTTDVLIVYFAGHGLLDEDGNLYLATTTSSRTSLRWSGIKANDVRDLLRDAIAATRILVLDCCFSGRAIQAMSSPADIVTGQFDVAGTVTIASAPPNSTALAPVGARYTTFTGELLSVISGGEASVSSEYLDLETTFHIARRNLRRNGHPDPQILNQNAAHHVPLTRNAAHGVGIQREDLSATAAEHTQAGHSGLLETSRSPHDQLGWRKIAVPGMKKHADLALGPNAEWIVVAGGNRVIKFDLLTGQSQQIAALFGPYEWLAEENFMYQVLAAAGGELYIGVHDSLLGTRTAATVWAADGKRIRQQRKRGSRVAVRMASSAKVYAVFRTGTNDVTVWGLGSESALPSERMIGTPPLQTAELSPSGAHLATRYDDEITMYSVATGQPLWTRELLGLRTGYLSASWPENGSLGFSLDGRALAAAGASYEGENRIVERRWRRSETQFVAPPGQIRIWEVGTGDLLYESEDFTSQVKLVMFVPSSRTLLLCATTDELWLLDSQSGIRRRIEVPEGCRPESLRSSPDGLVLGLLDGPWIREVATLL